MIKICLLICILTPSAFATIDCKSPISLEDLKRLSKEYYSSSFDNVFSECPTRFQHPGLSEAEQRKIKAKMQVAFKKLEDQVFKSDEYAIPWTIPYVRAMDLFLNGPASARQKLYEKYDEGSNARMKKSRDACTEIEVDTSAMGPVRNQSDTDWCYAYSAADLLSFHLGQPISAVDIALNYNQKSLEAWDQKFKTRQHLISLYANPYTKQILKESGFEEDSHADVATGDFAMGFGNTRVGIETSMKSGVCRESDLQSSLPRSESMQAKMFASYYLKIGTVENGFRCTNYPARAQAVFKNLELKQIEEIIQKSSPNNFMAALRNSSCKVRIPIQHLRVEEGIRGPKNFSDLMDEMNSTLSKKEPVEVGYNMRMLRDAPGGHSSNVVGRRFNEVTGLCEYKFRNSAGSDPLTGLRKKHVDGYFWASEIDLFVHMLGVTTVKKK